MLGLRDAGVAWYLGLLGTLFKGMEVPGAWPGAGYKSHQGPFKLNLSLKVFENCVLSVFKKKCCYLKTCRNILTSGTIASEIPS